MNSEPDAVDAVIAQWKRERPELDTAAMALAGRFTRAHALGMRRIAEGLAQHGLSVGEFDVLATLRRSGKPYQLSPTELAAHSMLSTSAMTNRLDRLQKLELVERRSDPADRRALRITLTTAGKKLIDRCVEAHLEQERRLFQGLSSKERNELDRLLRKMIVSLDM